MPPCTWPSTIIGLTMLPEVVHRGEAFSTRVRPVSGSTSDLADVGCPDGVKLVVVESVLVQGPGS